MVNIVYRREYLPHQYIGYHLKAQGHADYAKDKGDDIVCAGVSALFYTLANYLEYIGAEDIDANDEGEFDINCKALHYDKAVHTAFRMTVFGIALMEEQYPNNISLTEESD